MKHAEFERGSREIVTAGRIFVFALTVLLVKAGSTSLGQEPKGGSPQANKLVVKVGQGEETINRNIYGHFAEHLGRCIYDGFWVGEDSCIPNTRGVRNDVVAALRAIKIPVLRWPGGCFADTYHWKDGIGPRQKRPPIVNVFWGGVTEKNEFGTHEFLDLCEQLGCEPYICGNVGSGTVRELQEWVEYTTLDGEGPMSNLRRQNGRDKPWKVKYWGIGNENWGCGGRMRPEYYADLYRRFSTYVRGYGDNQVYRIGCGAGGRNLQWTEVVMREAGRGMQALAFHYYCGSGRGKKLAAEFDEGDWFAQLQRALRMDELVIKHSEIMEKYDPERRVDVIVDEWGTWHRTEPGTNPRFLYQQNTLHDALVAGVTLNIFNNHCDRVKMANIAQTVNVLQAMILTEGPKMILTPTYHVFEMYKVHHDATMLPIELQCADYTFGEGKIPSLNVSASRDSAGRIHISVCNLDPKREAGLSCELKSGQAAKVTGRVLTHEDMNAHNTFDNPEVVKPGVFEGAKLKGDALTVTVPAKSVIVLELE
ncbi:MAG: alpha-N-arabinofuranosidase [Planctomycetota bacterium]|jgi:alpha-N-arabinofuranosidase